MIGQADNTSPSDIAIVGMSLRVPGAKTPEEFWQNLRDGVESIRTVTREELVAGGEAQDLLDLPNYVPRTSEIPDMEMFDADFFGMSPKDAAIMDPQHRHFLECAWAAMEDAGLLPEKQDGPVGVFAGCGMGSYFYFNICSRQELVDDVGMFLLRHTGNDKDFLATRVSYAFDLRGPSVNVQTACSTSLVAIHQACQSLLNGECDAALAGGVTIEQPHRRGYLSQEGEILSPDGHCRPFDHRAAGTVFGSGAAVVVLKRLADAIADRDHIHAVIKATAVNNDGGRKSGYLAPSVTGQASAAIEAMGLAGISADTIQYVECHGTGTYLGDPIEIQALNEAFRQSGGNGGTCYVGSVKSNIGHLDTAAGVVSLIKTVLSLQNQEIPPTIGFETPNPAIAFEKGPFKVADRLLPWPKAQGKRRAAVNSLGVGGTNAHAILEAYDPLPPTAPSVQGQQGSLLLFSGRNRDVVMQHAQALGKALDGRPALSLEDAAYTLATRRKAFDRRAVMAVRSRENAIASLSAADCPQLFMHEVMKAPGPVVFLLSGGGSQYPGMAAALYRSDATFRRHVDEGLDYLPPEDAQELRRVWLSGSSSKADVNDVLQRPSMQLPAIAILEVALARLWESKGVKPGALLGHSMGENAAACIADVMSFRDMVRLVHLRGRLFETVPRGGMLAVSTAVSELRPLMPDDLSLASVNAPELCVVSGSDEALLRFQQVLKDQEIDSSRVPIDIAAHSHMLDGILAEFEAFLRSISLRAPKIQIMSNVTGTWLTEAQARDPVYWVQHLRSTVQFAEGMAVLTQNPNHVYIEVGPGRVLSSIAKLQPGVVANQVINSLPHPSEQLDDDMCFLAALGRCWAVGLDVEPVAAGASEPHHVSLPTYAFQHSPFFIDRAPASEDKREPALVRQADMADWGYEPVWKPAYADPLDEAAVVPACWLALLDGASATQAVVERLRGLGHTVVTAKRADAFARHSSTEFSLCVEDGEAAYNRLLEAIRDEGHSPTRIVHALLVEPITRIRMGSDQFNAHQDSGFFSLFYLIRALDRVGLADDLHIDVLTTGMHAVGSNALPYPEKALICGPAQVIPKEFHGTTVRLIDLNDGMQVNRSKPRWWSSSASASAKAVAKVETDLLWDDILSAPNSEIVAYRDGKRWRRDHRKLSFADRKPPSVTFRDKGVYMLTGGLGDLALALATDLVERCRATIVLTGRSQLPDRSQWALYLRFLAENDRTARAIRTITALEAKGATVLYIKADVTSDDDMTAARLQAEAAFGPIQGVLHTAGVVSDNLIQMKTLQEIDTVLAPKVHGTAVLDRVFEQSSLDFLVLFSSTSSDLAPAGQIDYVAANAFLNAYAESRKSHPTRKTVAVHWGIWSEVGIAARAYGNTGSSAAAEAVLEKAKGPIFAEWIRDSDGQPWLEAVLSAEANWFVNEHRLLDGTPVVPGTGYIEFIAQAMKEYGMALPVTLTQIRFLSGIFFKEGQTRRVRIRIKPLGDQYHVLIAAENGGDFVTVVDAQLTPRDPLDHHEPLELPAEWRGNLRNADAAPLASIQEDRIRFGSRWKVLRRSQVYSGKLYASLGLPEKDRRDIADGYLAHPGLMDIATGAALALLPPETLGSSLWIPVVYGQIDVYCALPADVISITVQSADQEHADGFASFDITIVDQDGNVVMAVRNYVMKRLANDSAFIPSDGSLGGAGKRAHSRSKSSDNMMHLNQALRHGIRPSEGLMALEKALATGRSQPIVSSIEFSSLAANVQRKAAGGKKKDRGATVQQEEEGASPRSPVERTLTGLWKELLGLPHVAVDDDFFDVGGHSLIAVRLFRSINKTFAIDMPMSVLFEAPTIAQCARVIEQHLPQETASSGTQEVVKAPAVVGMRHVVPMSAKDRAGRPLFICAGMFGNVLNLRQLAMHLASDRPVYGLQARGLFGGLEPHETFEDMARDYIAEIRSIQPSGPYHLAGFSGGGLIAYEMAQQLVAAGEEVSQVIMLDTPIPGNASLSVFNRIEMKMQDLKRHRMAFFSNWVAAYARWIGEWRVRRSDASNENDETAFHNRAIEAAFYRALSSYRIKRYAGAVLLLRPKLDVLYTLRDGRRIQVGRREAREDNGWSPFIPSLTVSEVSGTHDSMVLEPHVRGLVASMKAALLASESTIRTVRTPITDSQGGISSDLGVTPPGGNARNNSRPEGVA